MKNIEKKRSSELLVDDDYINGPGAQKADVGGSQNQEMGEMESPVRTGDQGNSDFIEYKQQLRRFNDGVMMSEQRLKTKEESELAIPSKQVMSVDRRNMRRDEANQIIQESRKYLQERRCKRKSQTADELPEQSSVQEESGLESSQQSVNMNINKQDLIDQLVKSFDQHSNQQDMNDQQFGQSSKRNNLDFDDLQDALNADIVDNSSSMADVFQNRPAITSDVRIGSDFKSISEKGFALREGMNFGTDTSYQQDENELLIRDEDDKQVDQSASAASFTDKQLDRMIFQDDQPQARTGKRNQSNGGPKQFNEEISSTDRVAKRTDESMQQSVSGSAHNIFGRAVPETVHESFSSLNTNLQNEENERQLQKYEADIRQHISIEQQLQIYIDSLKQKIEDMENDQLKMDARSSQLMQTNQELEKVKMQEIEQLKYGHKQQIQKQSDQIATLQKEKEQIKSQIELKDAQHNKAEVNLRNTINDLRSQNTKAEDRMKRQLTQIKQLQGDKEKLSSENTLLKTEKNKLKQDAIKNIETISGLKKSLEASHRRKLSMQSQQPIYHDQQIQQQTTIQPKMNSVRYQQRSIPNGRKDQLVGQIMQDLEVSGKKMFSMTQIDLDKNGYQKIGDNTKRKLEQVVTPQMNGIGTQGGSPFPVGSESDIQQRLAPKSQRASKKSKNIFLQEAIKLNNQQSARNVSADRIKLMDNFGIDGKQQQLLMNQSKMLGLNGKSQPQLIYQDTLQIDNHRGSNQSLKKRIPLKKSGGGQNTSNSKLNNSALIDVSQSAPVSRKQSIKRAGDHLIGNYLMAQGMDPKQSIESTFSYNINKPNLQKYLKQNRNMMLLKDPKKRVQSVTVVPTRNTTLQKVDRPQRNNINQRASSINSSVAAQQAAMRSIQPNRANESLQKQRKKGVQSSLSKSPDFGQMIRTDNQHTWMPSEGITIGQNTQQIMNLQDLTQPRPNNTTRQLPVMHRSSIVSSQHGQSPSKDAYNGKQKIANMVAEEGLTMSNQNGVDSRGSYSGHHLLYTGGGTGEPISSFQQQQLLSGNNSIHQTRQQNNQIDGTNSQGRDVVVSVDLQKSKQGVSYKPQVPSQQNLNQFIQMNLIQLQKSGINLVQGAHIDKDDNQIRGIKVSSDQAQTRAQSTQHSQPRIKNRVSGGQKNKSAIYSNESQPKSKSSMNNRQADHGVQSSARHGQRQKNTSTSINSHSKLNHNHNTRSIQNLKVISREGAISCLGPQKTVGINPQANLNVQPNLKISASQIQLHGQQRLGPRMASNMSQASDMIVNRLHTVEDVDIMDQHHNGWEGHQLIHPVDVEFNGPGTRLEFLDVDGSSDTQEHYLNRPLSQIDIRDVTQGLIDGDSGQNVNTAGGYNNSKVKNVIQTLPNTNNQRSVGQRGPGKIKNSHRASQDAQNTGHRRTHGKQSYNHSISSVQSLVGSQSMLNFKQTASNNQNNMVLVDSKNIPYGEIITVPASQAKDIVSQTGNESRNKSNWQQVKQVGGRGGGNSKSVIHTKSAVTANGGKASQINRNQTKSGMESHSRTKNLVQNFVSKTYGQQSHGGQGPRKSGGSRGMPQGIGKQKNNQAPALVRSLHIDLTNIEDKMTQNQQQQKGNN